MYLFYVWCWYAIDRSSKAQSGVCFMLWTTFCSTWCLVCPLGENQAKIITHVCHKSLSIRWACVLPEFSWCTPKWVLCIDTHATRWNTRCLGNFFSRTHQARNMSLSPFWASSGCRLHERVLISTTGYLLTPWHFARRKCIPLVRAECENISWGNFPSQFARRRARKKIPPLFAFSLCVAHGVGRISAIFQRKMLLGLIRNCLSLAVNYLTFFADTAAGSGIFLHKLLLLRSRSLHLTQQVYTFWGTASIFGPYFFILNNIV